MCLNASETWRISRNMKILIVTMYKYRDFFYLIGIAQVEKCNQEI